MINRFLKMLARILTWCLGLLLWSVSFQAFSEPLNVFVSILPQKYFVEKIAVDHVTTEVMVGPGQSPETYEPLPKQLVKLTTSDIYFSIGVPFEKVWMPRISRVNPNLEVVDTSVNAITYYGDQKIEDPHIWVSPVLAKSIADSIARALIRYDPENAEDYQSNVENLKNELDDLHHDIIDILGSWSGKGVFLVMHPAWGYFAKTYGLEQIAIEHEGKSPGAKSLQELIRRAKQEKIQVIFIQEQHSSHMAETVASAINARIVRIDPLAEDYDTNLRKVAMAIAESFR